MSIAFIYSEEIMFSQRSHTPNIKLFIWMKAKNCYWFALFDLWQVQNTGHRSLFYQCKKYPKHSSKLMIILGLIRP